MIGVTVMYFATAMGSDTEIWPSWKLLNLSAVGRPLSVYLG